MKIELHKITVRELTEGYADNAEQGVKAYGGRLMCVLPTSVNLSTGRNNVRPSSTLSHKDSLST